MDIVFIALEFGALSLKGTNGYDILIFLGCALFIWAVRKYET